MKECELISSSKLSKLLVTRKVRTASILALITSITCAVENLWLFERSFMPPDFRHLIHKCPSLSAILLEKMPSGLPHIQQDWAISIRPFILASNNTEPRSLLETIIYEIVKIFKLLQIEILFYGAGFMFLRFILDKLYCANYNEYSIFAPMQNTGRTNK